MDADAEDDASSEQQRGESAVLPSTEHQADDAGSDDEIPDQDRAARRKMINRCRCRGGVRIAYIEQPVAEAAGDLG